MATESDRTRETRLRRMAERQGLHLEKSRRRDPRALDYGEYYVSDATTGVQLAGYSHSLRDLDAVEYWLNRGRPVTNYYAEIDTPQGRHEIGPTASAKDLAIPLAHAVVLVEKHGSPRPDFRAYAEDGERARDLTTAERKAFETALEQALEHVRPTARR